MGKKEYPVLTSKEATADYYKFFKTSVCENTGKINSQPKSLMKTLIKGQSYY